MKDGGLTVIEASPAPPAPLRVIACPNPFKAAHEEHSLMPGKSLLEILREVQPDIHRYRAHVWVGEDYIPEGLWAETFPAPGSEITIRVVPQGAVGRIIGMIFVAIAAIAVAYFAGPALAGIFGGSSLLWGSVAGLAVSIVGNMVLNALIPPTANPNRQAQLQGNNLGSSSNSPTYSLTGGSNVINKYGPVPKILGRNKVAPNFGARTYTEMVGGVQYLRCLFVWGFAPVQVEDLRIGSTPLGNFAGVEIEHRNLTYKDPDGVATVYGDDPLTLYSQDIQEEALTAELTAGAPASTWVDTSYWWTVGSGSPPPGFSAYIPLVGVMGPNGQIYQYGEQVRVSSGYAVAGTGEPGSVIRTSQLHPDELSVDITCPNGLQALGSDGSTSSYSATFNIYYRVSGTDAWLVPTGVDDNGNPLTGQLVITANSRSSTSQGMRWVIDPSVAGQPYYDVKVARVSPGPDDIWHQSISYWTALRTIRYENPLKFPVTLAVTAMRIKASGQLNGTVDQFTGIATGIYRDWDKATQTWILRPTQNPASLALEWLTGPHKQNPYLDSEINLAAFQDWHEYCEAEWLNTQTMSGS